MNNKGFTLIELMVAMLIVVTLSTIGMMSYRAGVRRSNDAKKIEDMKSVQRAMEQYYAAEGNYTSYSDGALTTSSGDTLLRDFPESPEDDKPYSKDSDADGYCYCAQLNKTDGGNSGADCNYAGEGYYCVDNRQ